MSIVFPNFFTYFCDILHNYDTFPCIQLIFQPEPFAEYRGSSRTHVRLGAWFWSAKADIFFSESLHIPAERLSQSEIVLPLRKTCYYSPLAEVGVFSTEIKCITLQILPVCRIAKKQLIKTVILTILPIAFLLTDYLRISITFVIQHQKMLHLVYLNLS